MTDRQHTDEIHDVLGSVQIAATAIEELMVEQLHKAAADGLTFQQLKLLKLIASTDSYTLSDVAAFLGVSKASASRSVDRLVKRGLVRRDEAEADRRAISLSLTGKAARLLSAFQDGSLRAFRSAFDRFKRRDLRELSRLLDHLSLRLMACSKEEEEVCLRCGIYFKHKCLLKQITGRACYYDKHKVARKGEMSLENARVIVHDD